MRRRYQSMAWAHNRSVIFAFAIAAERYWLTIFPQVVTELRHWRRRAQEIPDPVLRRYALATHDEKRAHSEGAAAFATLVGLRHRRTVVRGAVALQAMYDYLDTISEQPGTDPFVNGYQLHRALVAAIDPHGPQPNFYAFHSECDDGGYLQDLVGACRAVCRRLPAYSLAAPALRRSTVRAMESQAHTHSASDATVDSRHLLAVWARGLADPACQMRWWELASAAGSSLAVHALLAAAANPSATPERIGAIEELYFPWGGGLQGMLDSHADEIEDRRAGNFGHAAQYASHAEGIARLAHIANRTCHLASSLPDGHRHAAILASMVALYLSAHDTSSQGRLAASRVLETFGPIGPVAGAMFRLWRWVGARREPATVP